MRTIIAGRLAKGVAPGEGGNAIFVQVPVSLTNKSPVFDVNCPSLSPTWAHASQVICAICLYCCQRRCTDFCACTSKNSRLPDRSVAACGSDPPCRCSLQAESSDPASRAETDSCSHRSAWGHSDRGASSQNQLQASVDASLWPCQYREQCTGRKR